MSNGEYPGYPTTTISAFGLSNNQGNGGWKDVHVLIIMNHLT